MAALALGALSLGLIGSVEIAGALPDQDLAAIEGVRENQLVGYGLVTGLNGTGDTLNNCPMTRSPCRR